jgi:hypothetical protein
MPPQGIDCNNTSPKSIDDYMRKRTRFGYGITRPCRNISFPRGALTSYQSGRVTEANSGNGIQQYKSKIHWRLYEKKCPIRLWYNKGLVQHFIPWRCLNKVSVPTASWIQLREWNTTIQVQNPSKIMWRKVPSSSIKDQGPGAIFHSLEVP